LRTVNNINNGRLQYVLKMIEKNIFQSWHTTHLHPVIMEKIETFKRMNPEYTYHLFTDNDMDNFVNEHFKGEVANCYNRLNIIVAKVDFWRYLVLYKFGGVYLDLDSSIDVPLNELIRDEDKAIITAEGNPDIYVQWALIFSKNHPILKRTIEFIVDNIKNNRFPNDIHRMTGPHAYSRAINSIHKKYFNTPIKHSMINRNTDHTFEKDDLSYRLYGIDYNGLFCFKYANHEFMYQGKKHWRQEQAEKSLLLHF